MPAFVVEERCRNNSECVEICPGDIMRVDRNTNKAYNTEPDMCWDCLSCVKTCPEHAIEIRPYADISPLGSQMSVRRDEKENTITWDLKYRDGPNRHFKLPIRTTQWNSISIPDSTESGDDITGQELSNESPVPAKGRVLTFSGLRTVSAGKK